MCVPADASPPDLPSGTAGSAPDGRRLQLTSGDGTALSGFLAVPETAAPGAAGVVVLPDVRGHFPFYEQLCTRFAQAGHPAVTFDYFGRTAGLGPRGDAFDFWPEVQATTVAGVQADTRAAAKALLADAGARPLVTVGFCFGGLHSFLAAADLPEVLAGAVGFYGALDGTRFGVVSPQDHAARAKVPVLGLFGGADPGIPAEQRAVFTQNLAAAGVEHEVVVYEGAPHSFFDRSFAEHADESADAWRRVLAFLAARG